MAAKMKDCGREFFCNIVSPMYSLHVSYFLYDKEAKA
jgi:hypothetical protein